MGNLLKSAAAAVTGLALAMSAGAATALPADAAVGCNADFTTYHTVQQGSRGAQAKAVECLLAKSGYKTTVNGQISAAEANQIRKFRKAVGLDGLRVIGRRGWSALISQGSTPTLKAGADGAHVLRAQLALRSGGYRATPTTGTLDRATVKILKRAQQDHHLYPTGTVNAKTWKALQSGRLVTQLKAHKATAKTDSVETAATVQTATLDTATFDTATFNTGTFDTGTFDSGTVTNVAATKSSSASRGAKALAYAKKQLGDRYRYGATGPNAWDCSGLTMKSWKAAGKGLPHSAKSQYRKGKKVSKSKLQKGDLVFFYSGPSHVSIYAGGGKVIHASRPGKPVEYIKMKYMPYKGARRP